MLAWFIYMTCTGWLKWTNNEIKFYPQEAWETARSFVGGLDLSVRLLKSDDLEVSMTFLLTLNSYSMRNKKKTTNEKEKLNFSYHQIQKIYV